MKARILVKDIRVSTVAQATSLFVLLVLLGGCAQTPSPPKSATSGYKNSIGISFTKIESGSFTMGDAEDDLAKPVHTVTVGPFWMSQFEVTKEQFARFKKQSAFPLSQRNYPAIEVSFAEANAFCSWLSRKEKRHYRLPTEAEWEYACRGGFDGQKYPWGNADPQGRATFGVTKPTPVGTYAPNEFGLYDMIGNASEWVQDWYSEEYYSQSPAINPQGPKSGDWNILRGGDHALLDSSCSERKPWPPEVKPVSGAGIRVVMQVAKKVGK